MSETFNVGDVVEWTSQAGGHAKTKRGVIRAVLPPEQDPPRVLWGRLGGPGMSRGHESYIVFVGERPYWPRVSQLRRVT